MSFFMKPKKERTMMPGDVARIRSLIRMAERYLNEVREELQELCPHDARERGADSDGPFELCKDCEKRLD